MEADKRMIALWNEVHNFNKYFVILRVLIDNKVRIVVFGVFRVLGSDFGGRSWVGAEVRGEEVELDENLPERRPPRFIVIPTFL